MEINFDLDKCFYIPWSSLIQEDSVFNISLNGRTKIIKSLQANGYAAAKKKGLRMKTSINNDILRCVFLKSDADGRVSDYDYLRHIGPGQTIMVPWDLSKGAPAPEYRSIKKIFNELCRKYPTNVIWKAHYRHVEITRLA